jgi:hypothetical protein
MAVCVPAWMLSTSAPARVASAAARSCSAAALPHVEQALNSAKARYLTEAQGAVMHVDLQQVAHDRALLGALRGGRVGAALAEANRQLVRHVVRIRVLQGSQVLVDANPTSFAVAGSSTELRAPNRRGLGRLQITVQDVIGFIKLVHKLNGVDVVVRSEGGQMRTSLPAAATASLPSSGCTQLGSHRYLVRSFGETSFTGEPLTVWLLTAA